MLVPVEDNSSLKRDMESTAILNVDIAALTVHRNKRNIIKNQDIRIQSLEARLELIEKLLNK